MNLAELIQGVFGSSLMSAQIAQAFSMDNTSAAFEGNWSSQVKNSEAALPIQKLSPLLGIDAARFLKDMTKLLTLNLALQNNLVTLHKKNASKEIPQEITHQLVDFWSRNEAAKSLLLEFASPELWTTTAATRARASALFNSLRENFFDLVKACAAHEPLSTYGAAADWVSALSKQPELVSLDKAIPELLSSL